MPDDTSPHGGEAMHAPPDRASIPQPKPATEGDEPAHARKHEDDHPSPRDMQDRPKLPEHPEAMAVDVEDEDADPVVESGPGVDEDTGKTSVTRQPG
jgi:hypothetical protein